jgi:hypothetical protein
VKTVLKGLPENWLIASNMIRYGRDVGMSVWNQKVTLPTKGRGSIQDVLGGKVNILGDHSIGHSKKKVYVNMCPIPNGFRDRAV